MNSLMQPGLYSYLSIIGWTWSVLAVWLMFGPRGHAFLGRRWSILLFGICLACGLGFVIQEMERLAALAEGITPLDGQFAYGRPQIIEFAEALGTTGRRQYAIFQLGADTLAPPAFVCFLMAVYRSTIRSTWVKVFLTLVAAVYFFSVLAANALMPVIMLNYPDANSGSLPLLYDLVPLLDEVKYLSHGLAWVTIFAAWLWQTILFIIDLQASKSEVDLGRNT